MVGCWRGYLSGAMCRFVYGPGDATAIHCLLCVVIVAVVVLTCDNMCLTCIRKLESILPSITDPGQTDHVAILAKTLLNIDL